MITRNELLSWTLALAAIAPSAGLSQELELRLYSREGTENELLMRRSNYLELLSAAPEAAVATGPECVLQDALYRVEPSYPLARVEACFGATCRGSGMREIELAGRGIDLTSAPEAGKGALLVPGARPGSYILDASGDVTIRQSFLAQVSREGDRYVLEFAVPRSPISRVTVLGKPQERVQYRTGGVTVAAGGTPVGLPSTGKLRLEWTRTGPGEPAPALSDAEGRLTAFTQISAEVGEHSVWMQGAVTLDAAGRPAARTGIDLPGGCAVVDARSENLAEWRVEPRGTGQRLWVDWKSPLAGRAVLELVLETAREGEGAFDLGLPSVAGAASEKTMLAISSPGYLQVDIARLPEGARSIDPAQAPASMCSGGRPPALLVASSRPGAVVRLAAVRHEQVKVLTAVADLAEVWTHAARDGVVLWRARYLVKNNAEQFLRLAVPKNARVLSSFVSAAAVSPAFGANGELLIPLEKSGVRSVQAAAFPVEVTYVESRPPLEEGQTIRFTLPKAHLPVSTLRWKLGMPRDLEAAVLATNLQADAAYREVSYAGEGDEKESEIRGMRLFEETAPPLAVPFPELGQVENFSQDVLDPAGAAPFLEARLAARQTGRFPRSLAFVAAFLIAFGLVLYGPAVSGGSAESDRSRGRVLRAFGLSVLSAAAVGVTSFRPDMLAGGLYFALGLFLGVTVALGRWGVEASGEKRARMP